MSSFADGMRAIAGRARRALVLALETGEQGPMLNRFVIAALILFAGTAQAPGGVEARRFFDEGLPGLLTYAALFCLIQLHILVWPKRTFLRRVLSIFADSAMVSYGLYVGSSVSAFLFPLYLVDDPRQRPALRRGLYGDCGRLQRDGIRRGRLGHAVLAPQRRAVGRHVPGPCHHARLWRAAAAPRRRGARRGRARQSRQDPAAGQCEP